MTYFIVLFAGVLLGLLCGIAPYLISLRREMREQERLFEKVREDIVSRLNQADSVSSRITLSDAHRILGLGPTGYIP